MTCCWDYSQLSLRWLATSDAKPLGLYLLPAVGDSLDRNKHLDKGVAFACCSPKKNWKGDPLLSHHWTLTSVSPSWALRWSLPFLTTTLTTISSLGPDSGCHPRHRWDRDDDLRRWLPQPLCHRHSPGGGLRVHVCPLQGKPPGPALQASWRARWVPAQLPIASGKPSMVKPSMVKPVLYNQQLFAACPRQTEAALMRHTPALSLGCPDLSIHGHDVQHLVYTVGEKMDQSQISDCIVWCRLQKDQSP